MFERFTDRARRVLVLAQEEGRLLNHSFVGTEHILLGLIQEGDGVAARALESLGITLTAARHKVEETMGSGPGTRDGSPPFTPRAKKVLELALREALQLGHSHVGTEHLLLGLVREGEGVAFQVLVALGADPERVRVEVMRLLGVAAQPRPQVVRRMPIAGRVDPLSSPEAERKKLAVGRRWSAEAVVGGRRPRDFDVAYEQLAELAKRLGVDDLDADRLNVRTVQTFDGPGLCLSIFHELPSEVADPDEAGHGGGNERPAAGESS